MPEATTDGKTVGLPAAVDASSSALAEDLGTTGSTTMATGQSHIVMTGWLAGRMARCC